MAAFAKGLHVYVEKPLALSLDEADAMIAAWKAAGTVGMVGFNFRFHPLVEATRRRVAGGEIGRLVAVRSLFSSARRTLPGWKAEAGAGGGALADLATHHFDLIGHLTGSRIDAGSIDAVERQTPSGTIATVSGSLAEGVLVQMLASQTSGHSTHLIELLGETGHLVLDIVNDLSPRPVERPPARLARVHRLADRARLLSPREIMHAPGREPSFGRALSAFVDAALAGRPAAPDLEDGRRALALVTAAEVAARRAAPLDADGRRV